MPRRSPRCPDCSSSDARQIVYGLPSPDLEAAVRRGEFVLGGCLVSDNDPAWHCTGCGHRFGNSEKPHQPVPARTAHEWVELIKMMLPEPVTTSQAGELLGGEPALVIVCVTGDKIVIMEAGWDWVDSHVPTQKGKPFAKAPLRTPAARIAELIKMAWGKRISQYRWCPHCKGSKEPEMMQGAVCHGCAEQLLGVVH
jgi:hypothetical protein